MAKKKKNNKNLYVRACEIEHAINKSKLSDISLLTKEYRKTATQIQKIQWRLFYQEGQFNKMASIKTIPFNQSSQDYQRYKQTIQYQVVGQLKGWVSNRANEFKSYVHKSSLETLTKRELFKINKRKLWFSRELAESTPELAKLARKIFHEVCKYHRRPSFNGCNLVLDAKVCPILEKNLTKASHFDYWLKLSTLELGKPIYLPLVANNYFEHEMSGTINNSVQLNWSDKELKIYFTKKAKKAEKRKVSKKLGLDLGLRTLFASNLGDLVGRRYIDHLYRFDAHITDLAKNLQKQGIKLSTNRRYNRLVERCRESFKNEVRRCINRLVSIHNPDEIVVEKLNFQNSKLSKKMNRLLSKFGKGEITKKFDAIAEELGIKITYVNPAYTSITCPKITCGYVDRNNRNNEAFHCKMCGFKGHADVVGAKNIVQRSSWDEPLYRSKTYILSYLKKQFLKNAKRFSPEHLEKVLSKNPYFKDVLEKTTPSSRLAADNYRPKGSQRASTSFYERVKIL